MISGTPDLSMPTGRDTEALRWDREPEFLRPDYDRSLTAIAPALLRLLGREVPGAPDVSPLLPAASPRRARRVLVLCLDGFGFRELALAERFSALHRDWGTWLTSVFPSITSAAITSIYQGLPPARHGILGHHVWKNLPGAVVDMLRMQVVGAHQPLTAAGFDVRRWQREPGLLQGAAAEGLPGVQLMPSAIVGSGLSAYCYGDAQLVGYLEPMEGFAKAAHLLRELDRGWVGMYLPTVDTLTHVFGGAAEATRLAARHIEEALAWMASLLPADVLDDTALMVVTDHGQSDVQGHVPLEGEAWKALEQSARAIGFSGRVMHVYLDDPERQAGPMTAGLKALIGGQGRVFPYAEARELTGPVGDASPADAAWVRESLGDLVAVLHAGIDWHKPRPNAKPFPYGTPLEAHHGGLSAEELLVPLIVSPLSVLREA